MSLVTWDTVTSAAAAGAIPVSAWVSAAVAGIGTAASLAGLFRYLAVQRRQGQGPMGGDAPSTDDDSPRDDGGWTPVLGGPDR